MSTSIREFSSSICEALALYVYRLVDPRSKRTFYVGKGHDNRVFEHVKLAIMGEEGLRYDLIREIRNTGLEPHIFIHRHGLDEELAFEIEAALIDAYNNDDLSNEVRGHGTERAMMTASEIIQSYEAAPAQIIVPAIVIKIERQWHTALTADQLYERTRRYWRCNPENRATPPKYALAVARGIIREVYEIHGWEDYPDMSRVVLDPTRRKRARGKAYQPGGSRKGFIGRVTTDETLRTSLLGKSIRDIPFGSGNPIAYVNC